MKYGGRWATGVPPGLQNQCWALGASWVGSIPTCLRQKKDIETYRKDSLLTNMIKVRQTKLSIDFTYRYNQISWTG